MEQVDNKQNLDDIDNNATATLTAKDLKIVLSVLNIGSSRGLFKPEEFALVGELNNNVKKALMGLADNGLVELTEKKK
tara:strand:- start:2570 stop:2803 length:234 start_codon:yes stop_codon:yes gene_type:complete